MSAWLRTGFSLLDLQGCPQPSFPHCPSGGATLGPQWHPEEQPAQPPTFQLCPPLAAGSVTHAWLTSK